MSVNIITRFREMLTEGEYSDPYLVIPDIIATITPREKDEVIEELLRHVTPVIAGDVRRRVRVESPKPSGVPRKVRGAKDYQDHVDKVLKSTCRGADGYKFWGDFTSEDLTYYIEYRVNLAGALKAEIDHATDVLKAIETAGVVAIKHLPRTELERLFS